MDAISLKYGSGRILLDLPKSRVDVFEPRESRGVEDVADAVRRALAQPVDSGRLRDKVRRGLKAVLVVDDITRAVPNARMLPPVVDELVGGGLRLDDILVLVATGLHRPLTEPELRRTLGTLWGGVRIANHDPGADLELLGETGLGTRVRLNRSFLQSDVKVLVGDVEYHQFCGFGGGAKSVFPGLADAESIRRSHSRMELEGTGPGKIRCNPVRREIDEVGGMAGVDFIVNAVLNSTGEVVQVFCGDLNAAFLEGARLCESMYAVEVGERYDVVVASAGGYPKDIELYQSQKALASAARVVKKGGGIMLFAECREGHGSPVSYEWMRSAGKIEDVFDRIREGFVMGGHKAYQFAKAIQWADVHLHSALDPEMVRTFFMRPLPRPNDVLHLVAPGDRVAVLPQAPLTLVRVRGEGDREAAC